MKSLKSFFVNLKYAYRDLDKVLFSFSILLFIFGLINILTASSREAVVNGGAEMTFYFRKQLIALVISFIISNVIFVLPTKKYYRFIFPIYVVLNILLFYLAVWGKTINGASNWIKIPGIGFSFQPSEVMKIVVAIGMALLIEKYNKTIIDKNVAVDKKIKVFTYIIICMCIPAVLVFLQKDFGTMVVILLIGATIFFTSPINKKAKKTIVLFASAIACVILLVIFLAKGYILTNAQLARFNFFKPCDNYETNGYQVCNCFIAINNGGLLGVGLGNSTQKYSYIPEPHTDSVFAIFAEECGVLGATLLFVFYIVIIGRLAKIAANATSIRGKYIVIGIEVYLIAHIIINLGGIFGLIPLTGIPLPFLSYGGSYALTLSCALAIAQRIEIERKEEKIVI